MNSWIQLVLLSLGCLSGSLAAQQAAQPNFRLYSTDAGLPSPETYVAYQDSHGYMWFGTDNGVCRFDGYEFRAFSAEDGLMSNVVFDILEDTRGRIWFGTMTGEIFLLEGDSIKPYRFNHLILKYRSQFDLMELTHLQDDGTVYLILRTLGILRIDVEGNEQLITTKRPYARLALEIAGVPEVLDVYIRKDHEDDLHDWRNQDIQNRMAYLEIGTETERFETKLPYFEGPCTSLFSAYGLSRDHLLIFNCNHLFCFQNNELLWTAPFDIDVSDVMEDEEGPLWISGLKGTGLRRYENLQALRNGTYDHLLNGLSVTYIYEDKSGGLWVTTMEKGVLYCADQQLLIYNSQFGFSDDFVNSVAFKSEEELFAGCENGDIFQVNLKQGRIVRTIVNTSGYHNHDLLYQSETDALWSNAAYWKNEKWSFVERRGAFNNDLKPFVTNRFEKVHFNTGGELLGCNYAGFYIIDVKNDSVKFDPQAHQMSERTFAVYTDSQERVWIGNARGLFEFRDGELVDPGVDHPAFHLRIEDIDELPDGSLVFGTKGFGVVRWRAGDILQLSVDDGLRSNMIEDVHVDENGILWVGTLNGLNKINFDDAGRPAIRSFTLANGLPSNEVYKVKSYADQVWLCTAGGLVKFHEAGAEKIAAAPYLQYVRVNGEVMPIADNLELKHWQHSLEFRFLAINYRQNGQILYRYRLRAGSSWQYTQNLMVNYPQLLPGEYRFEVQAQNQDGYWSSSTTYSFAILPAWWNTWWARSLALMLFLAGVAYSQRRYIGRVKKEAAIQQKMIDLERSALQAQMNPHFIFNCLNSIQHFILTNEKKEAVEFLARFARLVRHNLNASVEGRVSLEEEVHILDDYLALERERFRKSIAYRIEVEESLEKEEIFFPPLLIQPYVENAVIHGLSKKEGGGMVNIHFGRDNGHLSITIRDNGVGYQVKEDRAPSVRHKSIGMSITQQRLELLGETRGRSVEIEVLKDVDGKVQGTEVRLRLNIGKS